MTTLSVVIPSYNHRRYIEAALRSLEAQTFRDFDVWIVDDGSTDGSVEVIERFIAQSRLAITLVPQPNAGAHTALNRAIGMSRGDIVAILNSDDAYHPRRLETMVAAAPSHVPFVAFSEFGFVGEDGRPIPDDPHNVWYRHALAEYRTVPSIGFMLIRSNISATTSNYVFSRSLYDAVGPFRAFKTAHDLDFLLRCVRVVEPIFVRETLLSYRIHGLNTINLNRDVEYREVRTILDDYVRAVGTQPPKNAVAPGAREIPLYSAYFLAEREHWSGPLAEDARQALLASLDLTPSFKDARAFRREVDRLTGELRRLSGAEAALAASERRAVSAEERLGEGTRRETELRTRIDALQGSTSWRITAPLRLFVRACRALRP